MTALGMTGRGTQSEVGTYIDRMLDSELSGNVIDLCPVGALTSKPYAFSTRPWELVRTESIDTLDAVGSAIRIDSRGPEVMRILPRLNEDVNEEWIGDKSRFSYDGLKRQRIDAPLLKKGDTFVPISWSAALLHIRDRLAGLSGDDILGVVGEQADAESMVALKDWMEALGSRQVISTQYPLPFDTADRSSYLFNSTIAGIEHADAVLLVNCNPRMEAAVLSARIRKSVRQFGQQLLTVGPRMDLNMPHTHCGDSLQHLHLFSKASQSKKTTGGQGKVVGEEEGEEAEVEAARESFRSAARPMVIVGMGSFQDAETGRAVMAALATLQKAVPALSSAGWNGLNVLHTHASGVGALDLGIGGSGVEVKAKAAKFVYLLGADSVDSLSSSLFAEEAFVVYAGSHGDVGAGMADLVLPSPAYTEKTGTYVNVEGRVQRTKAAVGRLAEAREDWKIIRALSELTQTPLPYQSVEEVRERLQQLNPTFSTLEELHTKTDATQSNAQRQSSGASSPKQTTQAMDSSSAKAVNPSTSTSTPSSSSSSSPLVGVFSNYFFTDPISRSSATMAKASAVFPSSRNSYTHLPQSAKHSEQPQQPKAAPSQPLQYSGEAQGQKAPRQSYA